MKPQLASWIKRGKAQACEEAEYALDSELTDHKEAAEQQRYERTYPLHAAVAATNLTAVTALLSSGKIDVNNKDDKGLTPLQAGMARSEIDVRHFHWKCRPQLEPDVAEYLVSRGADARPAVNPRSGYTLLHQAAMYGLTRLVKALLKGGADPNAVYYDELIKALNGDKQQDPQTPLTQAAYLCTVDSTYDFEDYLLGSNEGPDLDSTNGTIAALLDAGASVLPFGKQRPLTSFFKVPDSAHKCVEIGACSEAQVLAVMPEFSSDTCASSFLLLWRLQEKQAAAAAGKPKQQPQPAEQ